MNNKVVGYIVGGVLFAAGLGLGITGLVINNPSMAAVGWSLYGVGMGILGWQVPSPGSPPMEPPK
jgi:hypothetical protein